MFELNFMVKWMNTSYFELIFASFDEKSPFLSNLDTFWAIFCTFPIWPVSMMPWLLNWIIFWIESWVKHYWIEYWINHFWQNSNIELKQIGHRTPLLYTAVHYTLDLFICPGELTWESVWVSDVSIFGRLVTFSTIDQSDLTWPTKKQRQLFDLANKTQRQCQRQNVCKVNCIVIITS